MEAVLVDYIAPAGISSTRTPAAGSGGQFELTVEAARIRTTGTVQIDGLGLAHPRLASSPVRDIDFKANIDARFDRATRRVQMQDTTVTSNDVAYEISAEFLPAMKSRAQHPQRRLALHLKVPKVPCQRVLDSIPAGLVPELQGFELAGEFSSQLDLRIDWADIDATVLDADVGIDGCRVLRAPEPMSAKRLRGSFEHRVRVDGEWKTFLIGPKNPDFVPLKAVSRNLTRSLMTTEDSRFFRHGGFITKEFRGALIKNLKRERFAYGASSITMQVVKNVLLTREKTLSRKLQELFLTWHIEQVLTKERILEIYVNAIEYGPGLYGIKPAARQYFQKHPRRLNPVESAFFSSILPAPTRRYQQYCRGWVGRWTNNKIDRILALMFKRNRLDEEEYLDALSTPLHFRGKRSRSRFCKKNPPPAKTRT